MISIGAIQRAFLGRCDKPQRNSICVAGPGHSRTDRSLSITIGGDYPDGFLCNSFAGDDWKPCRDHVRQAIGIPFQPHKDALRQGQDAQTCPSRSDGILEGRGHLSAWRDRWNEGVEPRGTIIGRYLLSIRGGLTIPDDMAGRVIRYHPRLWHSDTGQHHEAMVCLFRNIQTNEPQALHRTWIKNGDRFDRKAYGPTNGAAIKLSDDEDITSGIHVGEGVETCLAGFHMGFRPVWALGSAPNIANFGPFTAIDSVSVFTERNDNGANQRAYEKCRDLWHAAGREVLRVDPLIGDDLNDAFKGVDYV